LFHLSHADLQVIYIFHPNIYLGNCTACARGSLKKALCHYGRPKGY